MLTESATNLIEGQYGQSNAKLIYGVFNTPINSIPGSAICAFSLQVSVQNILKKYNFHTNIYSLPDDESIQIPT